MNRFVMTKRNLFSFRCAPLLALGLVLTACGGTDQPPLADGALYGSTIGGPFELVDTAGKAVNWDDFDGKWRMVYFGYAYCPDVCPFDVQRMIQGYDAFAAEHPDLAEDVVPIFITIDPERDTPEVIGQFTKGFSDKLVGLTGTPEQIAAAANNYSVYFRKGTVNEEGGYLMDHSNIGYLMGREGEPVALLPVDSSGEAVAAELAKWVR